MLVCDDPKFCFIHIPHSAGMSMRSFLKSEFEVYEEYHKHAPASFLGESYQDYYKFAIVRNHWKWFKSMFAFLFKNDGGVYHYEWNYIRENNPTFSEFIKWYMEQTENKIQKTRDYPGVNNNLGGIFHWLGKEANLVNDYITFESGSFNGVESIEKNLKCSINLPHINRNDEGYRKKRISYTESSIQAVQNRFLNEIDYFNFKPPKL